MRFVACCVTLVLTGVVYQSTEVYFPAPSGGQGLAKSVDRDQKRGRGVHVGLLRELSIRRAVALRIEGLPVCWSMRMG